ncbi:hypothetical protein FB451DRAFT_1174862 [Mycena latifolia]|nr:hypothetical protein FB451DRAFT_1174862 [Mycena latifolia]
MLKPSNIAANDELDTLRSPHQNSRVAALRVPEKISLGQECLARTQQSQDATGIPKKEMCDQTRRYGRNPWYGRDPAVGAPEDFLYGSARIKKVSNSTTIRLIEPDGRPASPATTGDIATAPRDVGNELDANKLFWTPNKGITPPPVHIAVTLIECIYRAIVRVRGQWLAALQSLSDPPPRSSSSSLCNSPPSCILPSSAPPPWQPALPSSAPAHRDTKITIVGHTDGESRVYPGRLASVHYKQCNVDSDCDQDSPYYCDYYTWPPYPSAERLLAMLLVSKQCAPQGATLGVNATWRKENRQI